MWKKCGSKFQKDLLKCEYMGKKNSKSPILKLGIYTEELKHSLHMYILTYFLLKTPSVKASSLEYLYYSLTT